jgi:hypothetical protein
MLPYECCHYHSRYIHRLSFMKMCLCRLFGVVKSVVICYLFDFSLLPTHPPIHPPPSLFTCLLQRHQLEFLMYKGHLNETVVSS